jgi:hypothetical protein
VQKGALADAGRADDGDHLAALDRQVEPFQHRQRALADGVALVKVADLDERHH